jgi:hypothetical protein
MPYLVGAHYDSSYVWAFPDFPGQPKFGPFTLPFVGHGLVDVRDYAASGHTEGLTFLPRYRQSNHGQKVGDLIWTGSSAKLASLRFLGVLNDISASGYRRSPAEVLSRDGVRLGYDILAVEDDDQTKDLYFAGDGQASHFIASDRVVQALREAGVCDYEREQWEGLDLL